MDRFAKVWFVFCFLVFMAMVGLSINRYAHPGKPVPRPTNKAPLSGCGCRADCGCKKGECKCGSRSNTARCNKACQCDNGDCGCGADTCKCASLCNCLHEHQHCTDACGCVPSKAVKKRLPRGKDDCKCKKCSCGDFCSCGPDGCKCGTCPK
jgi:hypothetical protein